MARAAKNVDAKTKGNEVKSLEVALGNYKEDKAKGFRTGRRGAKARLAAGLGGSVQRRWPCEARRLHKPSNMPQKEPFTGRKRSAPPTSARRRRGHPSE